jgi:GT2 family glycosyltransferase
MVPCIDIIIPIYKQFDYTKQCIEKILRSSNQVSYEIIAIDDCSNDPNITDFLYDLKKNNLATIIVNDENLGFTKTVNRGMSVHPDRDVLLLNTDTAVSGAWLDKIVTAAYSDPKVATVIPLSNACHISNYPHRDQLRNYDLDLGVSDDVINQLQENILEPYVYVHSTVGFCMYIKRQALKDVGLFDAINFPIGYGEETDFCYRTRKVGWKHLVAGNVFVRHFEGKSFGEKKSLLMSQMLEKFKKLHPEFGDVDRKFSLKDPLASVRLQLDLARLKYALTGKKFLVVHLVDSKQDDINEFSPHFILRRDGVIKFGGISNNLFPNLRDYHLPQDIVAFNTLINDLGVQTLYARNNAELSFFRELVAGQSYEIGLESKVISAYD